MDVMEEEANPDPVILEELSPEDGYLSDPLETDDTEDIVVSTTPGGVSRTGYKRKERYGLSTSTNTTYDESTAKHNSKLNEELKVYR